MLQMKDVINKLLYSLQQFYIFPILRPDPTHPAAISRKHDDEDDTKEKSWNDLKIIASSTRSKNN